MYKVSPRPTIGCKCMVLVLIWGIAGTICRERAPTTVTGNRDCDFVYKKREWWVLAEEHGDLVFDEADFTILVTECQHQFGDFFCATPSNDELDILAAVPSPEPASPNVESCKDEVLSLWRQDTPERKQPALSDILCNIAVAWLDAWSATLIN